MTIKPLYTSTDQLPTEVPLLLLRGAILLPRSTFPLPITEKSNFAMIAEALRTNRFIGIVQPNSPQDDLNLTDLNLFSTGTLGHIEDVAEFDENKLFVTISGICRFAILEKRMNPLDFPVAKVCYEGYESDLAEEIDITIDRTRLLRALGPYFNHLDIKANWDEIDRTTNEKLITALMMVCPFEPNEKQALLESRTLQEQSRMITTLIEMAALDHHPERIVYH
jgi:Lon protease-like protein